MSLIESRRARLVFFHGITDVDLSDLLSNGIQECRERFGDVTTLANLEIQAEAIKLDMLGVGRPINPVLDSTADRSPEST